MDRTIIDTTVVAANREGIAIFRDLSEPRIYRRHDRGKFERLEKKMNKTFEDLETKLAWTQAQAAEFGPSKAKRWLIASWCLRPGLVPYVLCCRERGAGSRLEQTRPRM